MDPSGYPPIDQPQREQVATTSFWAGGRLQQQTVRYTFAFREARQLSLRPFVARFRSDPTFVAIKCNPSAQPYDSAVICMN
jgi:hypothetical protein